MVAHYQLIALGFSADAITYRIETRRLHPLHVGVYAVGHGHLTLRGRWMAAVLAYGPKAVLSHRDAAALWAIYRSSSPYIEVTADRYTRNRRPGLILHRPRQLPPEDVTMIDNIPVTTVERTLVDLAAHLDLDRLRRAWDAAVRLEILDRRKMEALRARSRGRRGLKKIDLLLAETRPIPISSRSDFERDGFRLFAEAADIPNPSVNLWIPRGVARQDACPKRARQRARPAPTAGPLEGHPRDRLSPADGRRRDPR